MAKPKPLKLRFMQGEDGSFAFDTGVLKGVLRQEGKSIGLVPVTYTADGSVITTGEGLFNHYRVFTHGKHYGYGARRWPSTAELHTDGSVDGLWAAAPDRPFELRSTYRLAAPNAVDLITVVRAETKLEALGFPGLLLPSRVHRFDGLGLARSTRGSQSGFRLGRSRAR